MSQTELCSQARGPEGEAGVYPNDWIFETVYLHAFVYLKQTETGEQGKLTLPQGLSHTALHCCPAPGQSSSSGSTQGLQLKAMGQRNTEVPSQPQQPMGNTELTHIVSICQFFTLQLQDLLVTRMHLTSIKILMFRSQEIKSIVKLLRNLFLRIRLRFQQPKKQSDLQVPQTEQLQGSVELQQFGSCSAGNTTRAPGIHTDTGRMKRATGENNTHQLRLPGEQTGEGIKEWAKNGRRQNPN